MKRIKVFITFLLSILFATTFFTGVTQAATFKDVSYKYWAFADINFITKHKVIRGYSDGYFRPGYDIKRKDAAVMMTRALDSMESEEEPVELLDMNPESPGYKEVMIAIQEGWLTLEEGQFNPDEPLTRDEMSKMLAIAFNYEGQGKSKFEDVDPLNEYYPYIDAIAFYEVTTGYNDNTFRPEEVVTRGQFSAFISRIYQKPVAYEVKSGGQVVAEVPSVEKALEEVAHYADGTIHPQSNKFVAYAQTIATADRTNLNSGVLIYNGHNEKNSFTPSFFDHYMRSTASDGTMIDMFDTFVVLGLRYNAQGNQFVDGPTNEANYSDWDNYVKRTFSEDGAIHNLNESARSNNRKVDVYVAIPYPKNKGDIVTLDGREQANSLYSRYDLSSWYINQVMNEFKSAQYPNLNFKGFYWLSETVRTVEDEVLISSISGLVKRNDKFFIYSPHATSTNFHKWENYGFDAAFLQPNAFRASVKNKEERLHRAFLSAQIYGTGITIEIDSYGINQVEQGTEAFDLYMDFAKRYGLDEKGMMFYQATNMVERMATLDHPIYKRWYSQLNDTFFNGKIIKE